MDTTVVDGQQICTTIAATPAATSTQAIRRCWRISVESPEYKYLDHETMFACPLDVSTISKLEPSEPLSVHGWDVLAGSFPIDIGVWQPSIMGFVSGRN
jgi:hypothetical protein